MIVEPKVGSIRFTQGRVTAKVTLKDGGTEYHTFYPREWTAPLPRKISVEEQKGLASGRKLLSQVGILLDEAIDECFSRNKV